MTASKKIKSTMESLTEEDILRLVRMGWEDRTTFDAIEKQFGLSPNQFVKMMRRWLTTSQFKRWRKRVHEQGHLKNQETRGFKVTRFKCSRQSVDGITKGWK